MLAVRNVLKMEESANPFQGSELAQRRLHTQKGEIHALMGENGAGKSTPIKIITGVYQKDASQIHLEGRPLNCRPGCAGYGNRHGFPGIALVPI